MRAVVPEDMAEEFSTPHLVVYGVLLSVVALSCVVLNRVVLAGVDKIRTTECVRPQVFTAL